VAVEVESRKVLAVGSEAMEMLGRAPEYIEVQRPLFEGVIADYELTVGMLRQYLKQVMGRMWMVGPEVLVCVPSGVTQVEQRAVMDASLAAGAKRAYLLDGPLATAIGAKIPVADSSGNMVVEIGGGASGAAVIALGGVVASKNIRLGGGSMNEAIMEYLRRSQGILVGEQTAENIKKRLASAVRPKHEKTMEVSGRDVVYGLPKKIELGSIEVFEAIKPVLEQIIGVIKETLAETPPELVADIADRGIVLSGGACQLSAFPALISKEIGVSAHVTQDPEMNVIKGVGIVLENLDV